MRYLTLNIWGCQLQLTHYTKEACHCMLHVAEASNTLSHYPTSLQQGSAKKARPVQARQAIASYSLQLSVWFLIYQLNVAKVQFQYLREFELHFVKYKNDIHVPACSTPEAVGCLVFGTIKIKIQSTVKKGMWWMQPPKTLFYVKYNNDTQL